MHRVRFLPVCCLVVSILFACAASPSVLRAQLAGTDLETEEQKTLYVLGVVLARQLTSFRLSEQVLAIVKTESSSSLPQCSSKCLPAFDEWSGQTKGSSARS